MVFYVGPCLFYYVVWLSMKFSGCVAATGRPILEIDIEDIRRPIWNIAHMVNAAYQVDYYMDEGANSIEFDITFDDAGEAKYTFHGVPCDCFRSCTRYERFEAYLQYLKEITSPGNSRYRKQLILLFLDLKLSKLSNSALYRAGTDIANKMLDLYWERGTSGAAAYVLLSLPSIDNSPFIEGYAKQLTEEGFPKYLNITGFDFSGNENLDSIRETYRRLNIDRNIWQGDGITNCLPRGTRRLRESLWRRDQPSNYNIDKVYWWTVDKMSTMRSVLRLGVDGIITNYPDRLVRVLREDEFKGNVRMADIRDNPFMKFAPLASLRVSGKSYMMARGGNISHMKFAVKDDGEDEEEMLDNREPPDEEHLRMELDPFPSRTPRLRW